VILGVDPENRNGRDVVVARHLRRELERSQGLEDREHRPAEETRLLAGHDGHRVPVRQQPRGFARTRRGAATLLLTCDHVGDVGAAALVRLTQANRVGPRIAVGGITGEERCDRLEVVGVVGGQPSDPGKSADIDRNAHGSPRGVDLHRTPYCLKAPTTLSSKRRRYALHPKNVTIRTHISCAAGARVRRE
jgi:hypothetical protein